MNRSSLAIGLSLVAFLAPASMAAAHSQSFDLPVAGHVGSVALEPGTYKLRWEGTGPDVEVDVLKGKEVLVTLKGKIQDLEKPNPRGTVSLLPAADGSMTVNQVRFARKPMLVRFGEEIARGDAKADKKAAK